MGEPPRRAQVLWAATYLLLIGIFALRALLVVWLFAKALGG